jgi:hypothetical protein
MSVPSEALGFLGLAEGSKARNVRLAGFVLDSLIEIGASAVVVWDPPGTGQAPPTP